MPIWICLFASCHKTSLSHFDHSKIKCWICVIMHYEFAICIDGRLATRRCDEILDRGLKCKKGWRVCGLWNGTLWVPSSTYQTFFTHIIFSFFFHVWCCLWFKGETQKTKGGGRLNLCEKTIKWEMEGCVASFLIVWCYLDFWMQCE
jgi:hypothetical protein